ncbi:hypothetical protein [Caballeronia udeis]|nr:hypothetical protein [Caballeronia udeis]
MMAPPIAMDATGNGCDRFLNLLVCVLRFMSLADDHREAQEHIHRMVDALENLYQLTNVTLNTSRLSADEALQQLLT